MTVPAQADPTPIFPSFVYSLFHSSAPSCRAHYPDGMIAWPMALAGRAQPQLRVARLRAEGRITEIGPDDLSLTRYEASSLLRDAGVAFGRNDAAELRKRTQGWPDGLYLAACTCEWGPAGKRGVLPRW
jgi:ATP/maltotriose-dependent transcriptional regulator MalT